MYHDNIATLHIQKLSKILKVECQENFKSVNFAAVRESYC